MDPAETAPVTMSKVENPTTRSKYPTYTYIFKFRLYIYIYIYIYLDISNIIIRILRENEKGIMLVIKGESIEYPRNDDTTPVAVIVVA